MGALLAGEAEAMNVITDQSIETCKKLLRGEVAAVQTYQQAMEKFQKAPLVTAVLDRIRDEHVDSARLLQNHLRNMGAEPVASSGVWGVFARAVEGTAKVFGESAALAALEQGERHGINQYEDALADDDVMDDLKALIRDELLPRVIDHSLTLAGQRDSTTRDSPDL
jgi:uncharacterized protein (TIGR02284 family)